MMPPIPPAFDPQDYRRRNPDLAALDDAAAADHFDNIGRAEGRVASPMALRETLIDHLRAAPSVLEIGPFCHPLVTGAQVEYLDILDAAELRARAQGLGIDPSGCPAVIHHVGGLDRVDRHYDAVVSAHAIEHQPDLIRHLESVARLLPPGGRYYLVVPDKRYCFDHFMAESTVADILQAWQEERRVHGLARVVDHVALSTHNDPGRHWRGDHGMPRPNDLARRIRDAVDHHDAAQGGYLDVHGWYFTPDSFRRVLATLAELGLSAFDATVYDTPHGRLEFCAILERRRPPRRTPSRQHGLDMIAFQTADPFRYAPMLAATAPTVIEYCRRHGFAYESFVGIRRGPWNWQATFNRIPMFQDLLDRRHRGWALYLDADAWIHDLDFDLPAYLADKGDHSAILATSGVTDAAWDVNAGVMFVNLGHPQGRALVQLWSDRFAQITDDRLHAAREWMGEGNDQDLLHQILRDEADIAGPVLVESMDLLNSRHARFIRQHLRAQTGNFPDRIAAIRTEVATVLQRGLRPSIDTALADPRWRARLAHRPILEPALIERRVGRFDDMALAGRILAAWRAGRDDASPESDFAALLDGGDPAALLAELAQLGRSPVAEGFLGGARQHRRAQDPLFAHRLALWTSDKLLSLAEAVGAVRLENPEAGGWDETARLTPADLLARIGDAIGIDPAPPAHIGGYLGIAAGDGIVLQLRILDAIHAAWRLRELADTLGAARVVEIGSGTGLTAFYAQRLGLTDYTLVDLPALCAVQAGVLGGSGVDVTLAGEAVRAGAVRILPDAAFATIAAGSADILFNGDTLPQRGPAAVAMLATTRRLGIRHFLSINQEAALADGDQTTMRDLIAEDGGWRLAGRHRHWLRSGYVEELYRVI